MISKTLSVIGKTPVIVAIGQPGYFAYRPLCCLQWDCWWYSPHRYRVRRQHSLCIFRRISEEAFARIRVLVQRWKNLWLVKRNLRFVFHTSMRIPNFRSLGRISKIFKSHVRMSFCWNITMYFSLSKLSIVRFNEEESISEIISSKWYYCLASVFK